MTTYLEQITTLGEADGLAHTGWNYPDTYREAEIAAYLKGYDRGYWFREYKLGYEAGYSGLECMPRPPISEAYSLGHKEGKLKR